LQPVVVQASGAQSEEPGVVQEPRPLQVAVGV
jgi:hypothetical protein